MTSQFHDMLRHNYWHQQRLLKLTEPLKQILGIDSFWQHSIGGDGQFISLGNSPDGASHHYEGGVYRTNRLLTQPENFGNGSLLLEGDPEWELVLEQMGPEYPLNHALIIFRKDAKTGRLDGFGFSSEERKPHLLSIYLNNQPLLQSFIDYWIENTQDIYKRLNDDAVNMCALRGEKAFGATRYGQSVPCSNDLTCAFLKQLRRHNPLLKAFESLSLREREVLQACVEGKTAGQTGKELHISQRTVEHHLDSIKGKFQVWTKAELRAAGQQLLQQGIKIQ